MVCTARARSQLYDVDAKWMAKFRIRVLHNVLCCVSIGMAIITLSKTSKFAPPAFKFSDSVLYYVPPVIITFIWNIANIVFLAKKQRPLSHIANAVVHLILAAAFVTVGCLATAYCAQGLKGLSDPYGMRVGSGVHDMTSVIGKPFTVSPENVHTCPAFPNCMVQKKWMIGAHQRAVTAIVGCILVDVSCIIHVVLFVWSAANAVYGTCPRPIAPNMEENEGLVEKSGPKKFNTGNRMTLRGKDVTTSDPTQRSAAWMGSELDLLAESRRSMFINNDASRSSLSLSIFDMKDDTPVLSAPPPGYRGSKTYRDSFRDSADMSPLPRPTYHQHRNSSSSSLQPSPPKMIMVSAGNIGQYEGIPRTPLSPGLPTSPGVPSLSPPAHIVYGDGINKFESTTSLRSLLDPIQSEKINLRDSMASKHAVSPHQIAPQIAPHSAQSGVVRPQNAQCSLTPPKLPAFAVSESTPSEDYFKNVPTQMINRQLSQLQNEQALSRTPSDASNFSFDRSARTSLAASLYPESIKSLKPFRGVSQQSFGPTFSADLDSMLSPQSLSESWNTFVAENPSASQHPSRAPSTNIRPASRTTLKPERSLPALSPPEPALTTLPSPSSIEHRPMTVSFSEPESDLTALPQACPSIADKRASKRSSSRLSLLKGVETLGYL